MVSAMKRICTKWGFWEEGDDDTPTKGGVSMLSHSNGSVAHGWSEPFQVQKLEDEADSQYSKILRAW
jgi:hypothetical protein